ncbi:MULTISPECIES: helix-turn-helix transcriptional regulator [unclassified Flavobacterium]|uniref:helix-turn-helix domain-containing protein n=1 Tax=unclassified Flavobacterium TaxID=196869 RepID=UPI001291C119|nr:MULTISPECIES: helix-turn-helix transcriptional regulator [unclassified Flavobacterium]MQP52304.1 helix-turn-helix domain-containing protein [Flavobacterium sp. LMO9]MQP62374.1 helix-turn-helix domain-containing protein [Flavobacterium sp. LMO6]
MVNIDDFIKRLEIILDYYNLSASAFADKINVQRSSLSHLLSGRNKPSLDFIIKVIEVFPEVDLYWILNGKGSFPKSDNVVPTVSEIEKKSPSLPIAEITNSELDLFSTAEKVTTPALSENNAVESIKTENNAAEEIERIVVFFKNGTFKNYKP